MIARPMIYMGAALAGGALLYVLSQKRPGESLAGAAGRAAVSVVGDTAAGAVKGVGELVGVPDTDMDQCSRDLAAGRHWDASFSCPASRFLGSVFNSTTINSAAAADAAHVDEAIQQQQQAAAAPGGVYDAQGNYAGY